MINAISSALSGLTNASKQVEQSAASIAQGSQEGVSQDRLIEDIVDIKVAETAYKANIETLKVANELTEELLKAFDETV